MTAPQSRVSDTEATWGAGEDHRGQWLSSDAPGGAGEKIWKQQQSLSFTFGEKLSWILNDSYKIL